MLVWSHSSWKVRKDCLYFVIVVMRESVTLDTVAVSYILPILNVIFVRVFDVFFCISGPAPGEFSFNGEQNCPCVRNLARPRLPNCQTHDQEQKNITKKHVFLMI